MIQLNVVSSSTENTQKAIKKLYSSNKKFSLSVVDMTAKVKGGVIQKSTPIKSNKNGVSKKTDLFVKSCAMR
ncbi:hypothetical protein HMPREF0556_10758 [Listeria grayi DSM 20601]|uniref:Uncharacterized protein n=1 Tax=Listeria grayi DSM 20601 TaxID=525367 RepID=D7UWZ7_LISGR|nr:hypothetical protein HMPREF0556_10758 [Listeria grayi DSM 20601]